MNKYRLIGTEAGGFTVEAGSSLANALLGLGYELVVEPVIEVVLEVAKKEVLNIVKGKK